MHSAAFFFLLLMQPMDVPPDPLILHKQMCMGLFSKILEIQDERATLSEQMRISTVAKHNGDIDDEEYRRLASDWRENESRLRSLVTGIYDRAYEKGCFSEELSNAE